MFVTITFFPLIFKNSKFLPNPGGILVKKNMKNLLLLYFAMLATLSQAQKLKVNQVPINIKSAFQNAYPNALKAKWSKENDKFEVEYSLNKEEVSVLFDASGKILETEHEISITKLPKEIIDYVKRNYKTKIKEAAMITDAKGNITYEAEIKEKDIIFDTNGKFIKELMK
jgi:hypothetical protein